MPVTEVPPGLSSGFNCAIGVLDTTVEGEAIIRDCGHIARRGRILKSGLLLLRVQLLQLEMAWKVEYLCVLEEIKQVGRNT